MKDWKYQWSSKADNGEIMVVRADTREELILDIEWAKSGFSIKTPVESHPERAEDITRLPIDDAIDTFQERAECPHTEFWVNTVKKEGPNKGKEFKSCKKCKKFLGFI